MKIYIMTDLEGVALAARFDDVCAVDSPKKRMLMEILTGEVNAAVEGILSVDQNAEVTVVDGHGNGGLYPDKLRPEVKIVAGKGCSPWLLDETYDGLFFVGQHAMEDVPDAVLSHTYSPKGIKYYKLNGKFVGEFGCRAILAGNFGVPTVFISGDDKAIEEAREMVPNIYGAEVKKSYGLELALSLTPEAARKVICETAAEACRNIDKIEPYIMKPPYELEIRYKEQFKGSKRAGVEIVDKYTMIYRDDDLCAFPI